MASIPPKITDEEIQQRMAYHRVQLLYTHLKNTEAIFTPRRRAAEIVACTPLFPSHSLERESKKVAPFRVYGAAKCAV